MQNTSDRLRKSSAVYRTCCQHTHEKTDQGDRRVTEQLYVKLAKSSGSFPFLVQVRLTQFSDLDFGGNLRKGGYFSVGKGQIFNSIKQIK